MSVVVLATRNVHKIPEVQAILAEAVPDIEVVGLGGYEGVPDIAETESTFGGNALLKARAVARHTGGTAVADDSGLRVRELNGMPGVLSARWAGRFGQAAQDRDQANMELVLDQLAHVPDGRREAEFVCAAALVRPDGEERVVEGVLRGSVTREPRGEGGFGYDPIFVPEGGRRTTAELSAEEKNTISHRGRAFRSLAEELRALGRGPAR